MSGVVIDVVAFAVVILVCVGIHEFGHFVAAKLCNIRVDGFSIGFGPPLFTWTRGETTYAIRMLPLGGFVRMAGMLGLPGEADAGDRNFYRASIAKRIFVMVAGIGFNLVLAFILLIVFLLAPTPSQVGSGTPAYAAGLRNGDSIVSVNGIKVDHSSAESVSTQVPKLVNEDQGGPLRIVYLTTSGGEVATTVTPRLTLTNFLPNNPQCSAHLLPEELSYVTAINGKPVGRGTPTQLLNSPQTTVSGISASGQIPCGSTRFTNIAISSLGDNVIPSWKVGVSLDYQGLPLFESIKDSGLAIWNFIPNEVAQFSEILSTPNSGGLIGPNGLSGPVGIAQQAGTSAQQGWAQDVYFIGFISMNLGFLNLVPIPFLDGGKILLALVEAVRRRRLSPEREAAIYAIGLAMIAVFLVLVTINDLRRH